MTNDERAAACAEAKKLLERSGLSDLLEYDGTLTIFDGRAHVAYISNHQSGERGRDVARFYAAAPRVIRGLLAALHAAQAEALEQAAEDEAFVNELLDATFSFSDPRAIIKTRRTNLRARLKARASALREGASTEEKTKTLTRGDGSTQSEGSGLPRRSEGR